MTRFSKTKVKYGLALLLLTLTTLAAALILYGLAGLIAHFQTGADPGAALNIEPNRPPDWPVKVVWLPDEETPGRPLEPFTRDDIEAAYIRSWLQLTLSHEKGEPYGLKTYFTLPARDIVSEAVTTMSQSGWQHEQIATSHLLQLHYYAADGSIVAFTDYGTNLVKTIRDADGTIQAIYRETPVYQVVMMLEDNVWKVRYLVRGNSSSDAWNQPLPSRTPQAPLVTVDGQALRLAGHRYAVRGVNYYPKDTPWDRFWSEYDGAVIESDLIRMQQLGFNTVRIFIPFEQFGGAEIDLVMQAHLRDFLNMAYRHDIRVIVTLFDFKSDYGLISWPAADRHLETLLTQFQTHPAILAWDLKNEPDLDFDTNQESLVTAWLEHTLAQARRYDPHHLITIGWADGRHGHLLADHLDFISFHFYRPVSELPVLIDDLMAGGHAKPVVITEFGLPTWNSPLFPHGHTAAEQAAYMADVLEVIEARKLAGFAVWTLYDFSHVPSQVAGAMPWQKGPQKKMGILTAEGEPKPAAALFYPMTPSENFDYPPTWRRFMKPFWLMVWMLGVVALFIGTKSYQYWRKRWFSEV